MPVPEVSVVVSTFERAHLLPRLVQALEDQTLAYERFEVVIVDDGSNDATWETLTGLAAETPLRLRPIRSETNRGSGAGRNLGIAASTAPVVAFTDDDCVPASDWLERGLETQVEGARVVVGRTKPDPNAVPGPFSRTVEVTDARFGHTCNIFYRRDDLEAVGGFDENLSAGDGEDTDLMLRVEATRADVAFCDEAVVIHDVSPSSFLAALRQTARWIDIPGFFKRYPDQRRTLAHRYLFWKRSHPRALLAVIGILASPRRPGALLLALPWLRFRTKHDPPAGGPRRRIASLPGTLLVDLAEVGVMIAGSIRHRTFLL